MSGKIKVMDDLIKVRLSEKEKREMIKYAKKKGVRLSEAIRQMITRVLARSRKKN